MATIETASDGSKIASQYIIPPGKLGGDKILAISGSSQPGAIVYQIESTLNGLSPGFTAAQIAAATVVPGTGKYAGENVVVVGGTVVASFTQQLDNGGSSSYLQALKSSVAPVSAAVQQALQSTGTSAPASNDPALSKPQSTTNPSNQPLPLGDDAIDKAYPDGIYDKNLTPEQVQSLSLGSQQLRAKELGYEYTGPANPSGERADNGDIVVTGTRQDADNFEGEKDWRVRLALGPDASYLYKIAQPGDILYPLAQTNGVIFPYTPSIQTSYAAVYDSMQLTHSNYKVQQYTGSAVDSVTITGTFTAQDVFEARYMLAAIHFFRSVTKMFYGQDDSPRAGTPPPMCFLYGMGTYQFSNHPLVIQGFTYNLPQDVDYIKTTAPVIPGAENKSIQEQTKAGTKSDSENRLGGNIAKGGKLPSPAFTNYNTQLTTYVPTKIDITINCLPIHSRNQTSNKFSLRDYANGSIYRGSRRTGGGFW